MGWEPVRGGNPAQSLPSTAWPNREKARHSILNVRLFFQKKGPAWPPSRMTRLLALCGLNIIVKRELVGMRPQSYRVHLLVPLVLDIRP